MDGLKGVYPKKWVMEKRVMVTLKKIGNLVNATTDEWKRKDGLLPPETSGNC